MSDHRVQIDRLLDVGRLREAEQLLQRALREEPGDPNLLVLAARIAIERDATRDARVQLETALAADPTHFEARLYLHALELHAKRYPEAESLIIGLIRDQPSNPVLLAMYARLMLVTLNLEKARALVDEALRIDPEDDTARLVDVLLSMIEGNRGRADVQLADLLVDNPREQDVAWMLLVSLTDRGSYREALEIGQQILRVDPDNEELIELLVDLRVQSHPLALPLRPMQQYGWLGSIGLWAGFVVLATTLRRTQSPYAIGLMIAYLAYVAYTWLYPPIMRRWVRARGF